MTYLKSLSDIRKLFWISEGSFSDTKTYRVICLFPISQVNVSDIIFRIPFRISYFGYRFGYHISDIVSDIRNLFGFVMTLRLTTAPRLIVSHRLSLIWIGTIRAYSWYPASNSDFDSTTKFQHRNSVETRKNTSTLQQFWASKKCCKIDVDST